MQTVRQGQEARRPREPEGQAAAARGRKPRGRSAPAMDARLHLADIHSPSSGNCTPGFLAEILLHMLNPKCGP